MNLTKRIKGGNHLRTTTLRGFFGGLNVVDDEYNLPHRFATVARNCFVNADGSLQVRYGTSLFAYCGGNFSIADVGIVNLEYFNNSLIAVGTNGEIVRILGDGSVSRIWDATIAASLPDAPAGWSATSFASFAQFNGHLIVCNGVDKPLDIDANFNVEYLQDAATQTNINVPICRYVVACQRYLVMAGDPLYPSRVHISARDAAGTWAGDPPPNDATYVDVGSVVAGATTIRGLLPFRNRLLVLFVEGIVIGELGIYDDVEHAPSFDDGIKGFGSVSHRAAFAEGDDGLMMDMNGVPSLKRTIFSGLLKPEYISGYIDPLITAANGEHSLEDLEDHVFGIYDKFEGQHLFFVPNADFTERTVFVYSNNSRDPQEGWSQFDSWNFTCAARSLAGRLFFGDNDGNVWLYGCRDAVVTTDFVDTISVNHDADGTPFDWEYFMPWMDFGQKGKSKTSKYINFDTRGIGEFTVEMYVDSFSTLALSMDFSSGDQGHFGGGPQPFGGGRNTSRKKLYAWPCKFEIARLRFTGSTEASDTVDKLVSITMHYQLGGIRI